MYNDDCKSTYEVHLRRAKQRDVGHVGQLIWGIHLNKNEQECGSSLVRDNTKVSARNKAKNKNLCHLPNQNIGIIYSYESTDRYRLIRIVVLFCSCHNQHSVPVTINIPHPKHIYRVIRHSKSDKFGPYLLAPRSSGCQAPKHTKSREATILTSNMKRVRWYIYIRTKSDSHKI